MCDKGHHHIWNGHGRSRNRSPGGVARWIVQTVGGTSATAPLWATLVARLNQALGNPIGFLNPSLYETQDRGVLRDITVGNIGSYSATPGWDACTGFGSPNGVRLLNALKNS